MIDDSYTSEDLRNYFASFTLRENERFFKEGKKVPCVAQSTNRIDLISSHLILNLSKDTLYIKGNVSDKEILPFTTFNYLNRNEWEVINLYGKEGCLSYELSTNNFVIVE